MELFLDTADLTSIRDLCEFLPVDGVTTNPTILSKTGQEPFEFFSRLSEILQPEQKIIAQVITADVEGMIADARRIASVRGGKNVVVKIPVSHAGMRAIRIAKAEGLSILATGIYSADQAFLAAKAGADYLAPYVNRMCAYGDGVAEVAELVNTLRVQGYPAKVCAASFKNANPVHKLIAAGIPSVTIPPAVALEMIDHLGTDAAIAQFGVDWRNAYGRDTLEG